MLLVTGASGFLGRHFVKWNAGLSPATAISLLPVSRTVCLDGGVRLDLTSEAQVQQLFASNRITGVMHLAAESRTGVCQKFPQAARAGNVDTTSNLLKAAQKAGAWFCYVSTDMVFSGTQAPYDTSDTTEPTNEYGRSKLAAEELVQAYDGLWCIIRPALIFGESIEGRGSSLSWTLDVLRNSGGSFFADEWRTPVFVDDLVRLLGIMAKDRVTGVYHAGGPDRISRWEFARMAAEAWQMGISEDLRSELGDNAEHDWRPRDLSLLSPEAHSLVEFTSIRKALMLIRDRTNQPGGVS